MKRFAVAITMSRDDSGKTNILTHLFDIKAVSAEEAVGIATLRAIEEHREHRVFTVTSKEFN